MLLAVAGNLSQRDRRERKRKGTGTEKGHSKERQREREGVREGRKGQNENYINGEMKCHQCCFWNRFPNLNRGLFNILPEPIPSIL